MLIGGQKHRALSSTSDWPWLVGLLVAGFVSRFVGLGEWDISKDEIYTITDAHNRTQSLVNPLYYQLVMLVRYLGDFSPEFAARLPAAVLGALTPAAVLINWREIIGRYGAISTAILVLVAEWCIWHSQYARFYSGVFLFSSIAFSLYYKGLLTGRLAPLLWSLLAAFVAIAFHITSVLVVAGCGLASLILLTLQRGELNREQLRILKYYVGILVSLGIPAAILAVGILLQRQEMAISWAQTPVIVFLRFAQSAEVLVLVVASVGWMLAMTRDRKLGIVVGCSLAVALGSLVIVSPLAAFRADYIFCVMPLVYLMVGYLASSLSTSLSDVGLVRHFVLPTILLSMLPGTLSHYVGQATHSAREAANFIEKNVGVDGKLLVLNPEVAYYVDDSLPRDRWIAHPHMAKGVWGEALDPYLCSESSTLIALRLRRRPYAPDLQAWLFQHARLVWRSHTTRFDWEFSGIEVYRVPASKCSA